MWCGSAGASCCGAMWREDIGKGEIMRGQGLGEQNALKIGFRLSFLKRVKGDPEKSNSDVSVL